MRSARSFGLLLLLLIVSSIAWPAGQVLPGQGQQPAPPAVGTGFVAGQVVDSVTGKPIPDAMVMISGRVLVAPGGRAGALPGPAPVATDSQGRYFFANLAAGTYTAQAGKTGYLSAAFGPIELADGERVTDWRVKLSKLASLSGTLRDEAGDPVVGTEVIAARRMVINGRQSWQAASRVRSDDRGMYRITGLAGGDYVVCACSRDPIPFDGTLLATLGSEPLQLMSLAARALSVGSDVVSLDNTLRTYAPTFYLNSAGFAQATRITLAPGDEKINLDMNVSIVRAARVSGTIVGAQGPVQAGSMRLLPEADAEVGMAVFTIPPMLVQPDGRFDFATVPPGQYRLVYVHRPNLPLNGPSGAAMSFAGSRGITQPTPGATMSAGGVGLPEPWQWASEPITVGESGVSGIVVALKPSLAVSGRVQWVGAAPQPPAQMLNRATVSMETLSMSDPLSSMGGGFAVGRFAPDATFLVPGALPGKYTITSNALPGYPTLKSVMVGGADLTDLPLEVGDKDVANVVITYVDTPMASLTVTVTGAAPAATGDQDSILVFPTDRRYWSEPAAARRRFRRIAVPTKGVATTPELPAGDYFSVYASVLEAADWMEPTKLDALSRRAQRVTVPDTGKAGVEVRR